MKTIEVLLLVDDNPGHYHLAEGVITALERLVCTNVTRIRIERNWWAPGRLLAKMANAKAANKVMLKLGYGINLDDLAAAQLVISAGGNTLGANVAAARALGADNIFIGSVRRFQPENFSIVVTSYERFADLPRHLVSLKPCKLDPDAMSRSKRSQTTPAIAGLLLGGDTPRYKYTSDEWQRLADMVDAVHKRNGTRWLISNSRRTSEFASDLFAQKAAGSDSGIEFIDFRTAGPGTLGRIFETADIIACTEDSSTMISEAIAARIPVIGLTPEIHSFSPQEQEYRHYLQHNNWTRSLSIDSLSPEVIERTLAEIIPMEENHLDLLASRLKQRLPGLLS